MLNVVEVLTARDNLAKSIFPSPLKVNDEVSRSCCLGKRKTRLHVFPVSEAGMSKLKTLETVDVTVPLDPVPAVVSGEDESMATIK